MLKLFYTADALVERLSRFCATIGVISILLLMVLITANTLSRYILNNPMIHTVELSSYGFILISYLGFAYAVRTNAHVGVDLIEKHFPVRIRYILSLATTCIALLFVLVLLYYAAHQLVVDFGRDSRSWTTLRTPIWVPFSVLVFGLGLFALELVLRVARIALGVEEMDDAPDEIVVADQSSGDLP